MRRLFLAVSFLVCSSASSAAEILLDPGLVFGPLGLGKYEPEIMNQLPALHIEIPLPEKLNSALPTIVGNPDGGLDYTPGRYGGFPELPGLTGLSPLNLDVELPGIDGLPISQQSRIDPEAPVIPGFDGLPLGFGRR